MFDGLKEKVDKKIVTMGIVGASPLCAVVPVFATEGGDSTGNINSAIETAVSSGFQSVLADVNTLVGSALPFAMGIMGIMLALRLGVKFFKSTAK